jgi:hypothetical protein
MFNEKDEVLYCTPWSMFRSVHAGLVLITIIYQNTKGYNTRHEVEQIFTTTKLK